MIPTYQSLEPEYAKLLDGMQIHNVSQIIARAKHLLTFKAEYEPVFEEEGVPVAVLIALNELESSTNFRTYFGNGDPLDRPTRDVPAGRGPFKTWPLGAIDAIKMDGLDKFRGQWTLELACYLCERWNGFGYRAHGIHTPYDFAWTSLYSAGKYTSDRHWDPKAIDTQIGAIPMIVTLGSLDASLTLPRALAPVQDVTPPAVPSAPPATHEQVHLFQALINRTEEFVHLFEDGNYGRKTRFVVQAQQAKLGLPADGVASETTVKAIVRNVALSDNAWKAPNIELAQTMLNEFGAYPKLNVDGDLGTRTKDALNSFQDTNGLEMTGRVDDDTIKAMQDKIRRGV